VATKAGLIVVPERAEAPTPATVGSLISPNIMEATTGNSATAFEDSPDGQKGLERIRRYIDNPPETSKIFTITPAIAKALLRDYKFKNRTKKPKAIARYADDMAAQRWSLTGDTIKFSTGKGLTDGQNRLEACVRAGVGFTTHVVFGIDDAAFDRMDQGRNRSGSDVLTIEGYSNTAALSGAVRWAHLIETGRAKQRDTYPAPEILRLLQERYGTLPDYIRQARSIYATTGQPLSLVTALLYLFHKANPAKASDFANAWETGNKAPEFKAIDLMQRKISGFHSGNSGRVHDVVRAASIIIAWNFFVAGRKGRKPDDFDWHMREPFPKISS
jgi:hypothetical protein